MCICCYVLMHVLIVWEVVSYVLFMCLFVLLSLCVLCACLFFIFVGCSFFCCGCGRLVLQPCFSVLLHVATRGAHRGCLLLEGCRQQQVTSPLPVRLSQCCGMKAAEPWAAAPPIMPASASGPADISLADPPISGSGSGVQAHDVRPRPGGAKECGLCGLGPSRKGWTSAEKETRKVTSHLPSASCFMHSVPQLVGD